MIGELIKKTNGHYERCDFDVDRVIDEAFDKKNAIIIPPPEKGNYVCRASRIAGVCARLEAYRYIHKLSMTDYVKPTLGAVFGIGKEAHVFWQNDVFGKAGVLVGTWICLNCGRIFGDDSNFVKLPLKCLCGERGFVYRETTLKIELYPGFTLTGHRDGILRDGKDNVLLEVKTINAYSFSQLKDIPILNHVIQMQPYMLSGNMKRGILIYQNKGYTGGALKNNFYRSFNVSYIPEVIDALTIIGKKVIDCMNKFDNGILELPERCCKSDCCESALKCELKKECFKNHI